MDKKTSDEMATLASHVLHQGNPLKSDTVVDQIIRNVLDAAATLTQEDARNAVREPLSQYFETAEKLAGSVLSQVGERR